jgi:hypothetical protein
VEDFDDEDSADSTGVENDVGHRDV